MLQLQDDDSDQVIAPVTQHQEEIDADDDVNATENANENLFTDYDIGNDIGISSSTTMEDTIRNRVTDEEYRQDVRSLNEKQYELFLHVLKTVKTDQSQFFLFITGGAGEGKTKLTKTLYQIQSHNSALFDQALSEKVTNKAIDIVIGNIPPDVQTRILEKAPILPGDSMGLPMMYRSAVGLRNELTLNLDVEDGLVNGAGGVCSNFTKTISGRLKFVWIHFDDPRIGLLLRRNSGHLYRKEIHKDWTPIAPVKRKFPVGKYKNACIQRDQFPLNLTCAKTIHKCQGDTLQDVVVQLPIEKRLHVHYVALSRVTTMNRLHIFQPFDPSKITVSGDVQLEMERLRTNSQVQLCYTPLYTLPTDRE
ncbi:RRM3-like protein [Mya arenaria]|uniref:RRM3-like protein n=1 Tax=Mya arenaria TaxID=6604 RepID=A0ABY7FLQ8_MYAAR|nr:RRM3-like protein [Mya arenaria]